MRSRTRNKKLRFDKLPRDYHGLIKLHMLRPIADDVDLENATRIIDVMAGHDLTRDQEDYLDVLSDLVDKYESENQPWSADDISPVEALQFLMEENGLNASDIGRMLGDRPLGHRILKGQREISKAHALILAERFKVSVALFI